MNKTLFAFALCLCTFCGVSSGQEFFLGKHADELRELHSELEVALDSESQLAFRKEIGGIKCIIGYVFNNDVAVMVFGFVDEDGHKFLEGIDQFAIIMRELFAAGRLEFVDLRLNGSQVLGEPLRLPDIPNFLRVEGRLESERWFSVQLSGSKSATSIEGSTVEALQFQISRPVEMKGLSIPGKIRREREDTAENIGNQ